MEKRLKLLGSAVACLPLAVAATQANGLAQPDVPTAGSWAFHHEHVLGTSLEIRVRANSFAEARTDSNTSKCSPRWPEPAGSSRRRTGFSTS